MHNYRHILVLLFGCLLFFLSGCFNLSESKSQNDVSYQISFAPSRDIMSKVANNNFDDYRILTYNNIHYEAEETLYFEETFDGVTNESKSGEQYYWPNSYSTINIMGYSPAESSAITTYSTNRKMLFFEVPESGDIDFTVAAAQYGTSRNKGDQPLAVQFSHMLSSAEFNVKFGGLLSNYSYVVESADLYFDVVDYCGFTDISSITPIFTGSTGFSKVTYKRELSLDQPTTEPIYFVGQKSTKCQVRLENVTVKNSITNMYAFENQSFSELKFVADDVDGDLFLQGSPYLITLEISNSVNDERVAEDAYGTSGKTRYITLSVK